MSRFAFMVGLLISALLHYWLLQAPPPSPAREPVTVARHIMPVVETDLARSPAAEDEVIAPKPAVVPPPEQESKPEPQNMPEKDPILDPVALETEPAPPAIEPEMDPQSPIESEMTISDLADLFEPATADPTDAEGDPRSEPGNLSSVSSGLTMSDAQAPASRTEPTPTSMDFTGPNIETENEQKPELRIDWGAQSEAINVVGHGEMRLAVLRETDPSPILVDQVTLTGGTWRREPYRLSGRNHYSNRLRVVDNVPAFQGVCGTLHLQSDERLVVLVPTRIERMMQTAQITAAFKSGMDMETIRGFGGRFTVDGDQLDFEIIHVQPRSREP